MAKTKECVCINYTTEGGVCKVGKTCRFYKEMQTCKKYFKLPGSKPNRPDRRNEKRQDIFKKENRGI